jgi:serine/threonine protein kinase
VYFAVKTLSGKEDFAQEVRMLKRLSNASEHIVTLFTTYHHREQYHLIFPWADYDLETYWKKGNPTPMHDEETVVWLGIQCENIAVALDMIHHHLTNTTSSILMKGPVSKRSSTLLRSLDRRSQPQMESHPVHLIFGRHGDIKPANLLWFPDPNDSSGKGIIKISDFGTGEFSAKVSAPALSNLVPHTPPYRPPECDIPGLEIDSSYDIWTLACLYIEFITWFIGGWELLETFRRHRNGSKEEISGTNAFFVLVSEDDISSRPQRAEIKPEVLEVQCQIVLHTNSY